MRIQGGGVGIESFTVDTPFVPMPPKGALRITGVNLPTAGQQLDHEITLMALEACALDGYTARWFDARTPGPSEPYVAIKPGTLQPGQRLRLVPGRLGAAHR